MRFSKLASANAFLPVAVTLILTAYQLVRVITFVNVYGGIEHDGGWALGVARSMAEQGTYTSMVATVVDPTVPGDISIDNKFSIQTPEGGIWFRITSIGPAATLPNVPLLKLLGTGYWALRAAPLLYYALFLISAAIVLYQLAGTVAIVMFHAFLYFYPSISIFLSYQALGEMPAIFYILGAYLAFAIATQKQSHRPPYFFAAGLVAGLALYAKMLALLPISGIFIWAGALWLSRRRGLHFSDIVWLGSGLVLVGAMWELMRLITLTRVSSLSLYLQQAHSRFSFFINEGSGLQERYYSGPRFFWDKFFMLEEVAHPQRWVTAVVFAAIFLGGLSLLWLWRGREKRQNLLAPMWLGWLATSAWFASVSQMGWLRHFWFGMVLAAMLLSVIPIVFLRYGWSKTNQRIHQTRARDSTGQASVDLQDRHQPTSQAVGFTSVAMGILLLALIGWGFVSQPHIEGFFLSDEIIPYWIDKRVSSPYGGGMPSSIIPRTLQEEVVDYIKQMPSEANVYYPDRRKAAEIPCQTGRVNYPLNRRNHPSVTQHPADIVIVNYSVVSPWHTDPVLRRELLAVVERLCPDPEIKNDYYVICLVEELRSPE